MSKAKVCVETSPEVCFRMSSPFPRKMVNSINHFPMLKHVTLAVVLCFTAESSAFTICNPAGLKNLPQNLVCSLHATPATPSLMLRRSFVLGTPAVLFSPGNVKAEESVSPLFFHYWRQHTLFLVLEIWAVRKGKRSWINAFWISGTLTVHCMSS